MKILIATNHSYMLWRFRKELIEALAKDHEVVLSMPFVGHEDDFKGMGLRCIDTPIDRRGIDFVNDMKLIRTYRRMLDEVRPDTVITYSIKPNIYLGRLCRKRGISYFTNVQGLGTAFEKPILSKVVSLMYRGALRSVGRVFFENSENAEYFTDRGMIPKEKATVLPGAGVNTDEYPYVEPAGDRSVCSFLFVGRLMKEKGVDEFFDAARQIKKEFGEKVRFDVVGFMEDDYETQVETLTKEGTIVFHGFRTDVLPYYVASDCVVLPSYHEGMSNVLLEGASVGRALITSDIPGCREAVTDGTSGYLCRPKDTDSLCDAIRRFADLDPDARREMGLMGRRLVTEVFDKHRVVEMTLRGMGIHANVES